MSDIPETQYAKTADGAHVAYQVSGGGPLDLVFMGGSAHHVELAWEVPAFARVFRRLASFSRLIRFDYRGIGLSDPLAQADQPTVEERAQEMLAVLDAVRSQRPAVVANGSFGLLAIFFAATYPTRTSSLVLDGCYPRLSRAPDYSIGVPGDVLDRALTQATHGGMDMGGIRYIAPSVMNDPELVAQWRRNYRFTYGPAMGQAFSDMFVHADVRPVLSTIQAPTLVLYRRGDRWVGRSHAEYLARHIDGAALVELPGEDNLIFIGDSNADIDEIEEFLTGARHAPDTDRVLATVLFTDIVGSTDHAAILGDERWKDLLDRHDQAVRRQLERFRGTEVSTAGDGFLATFDGPGRAIQCACAIRDAVSALGVEVRVGVHTGEIERRGNDVAGMAVHIGARISALAGPGEVLASGTVKDLVVGSGIEFQDKGEQELRGVPGSWRLYRVVS